MPFSFDLAVTLQREARRMKRRSKRIRRRQSDICKSHEPWQEFPSDLVIEILTRLPAKSLMRLKSVSKLWSTLICSQYFTNLSSAPRIYMWLGFDKEKILVSSSSSPDLDGSFVVDQDLTISAMKGYSVSHVYRVSRLKVVKLLLEHWVFTLGGGVSSRWRKIPCTCPPHSPFTRGLTINGSMYYLALVPNSIKPLFVRFDISSEKLSVLQKPEDAFWCRYYYTEIIEYDGRIAILDHADLVHDGVMDLWVREDEEKNRWSRMKRVLHPSQMNMIKTHIVHNMSLRVQGTTRNGDVILVPQHIFRIGPDQFNVLPQVTTHFYVFLYNLQKNHFRKVEIKSNRYNTKRWDVVGFDDIENLMYL
ncbi:hypothetical protein HID58_093222 [Brassica napus]|uniref:F-box domain-containing protein n=1 Tax=Brassica napus TaxID=3708 RepID=A0ABQ7XBW0_BRANA|nr:hypothetical protein HID58_093222 [Brassica napus]